MPPSATPGKLASRPIGDFYVGQTETLKFSVDEAMIESFAQLSGDWNPLHIDPLAAREMGHSRQVAHGAISVAFLSQLIGMNLPGPGALWMGQSIDWLAPVYPGDDIEIAATVAQVSVAARTLRLTIRATNQRGDTVMSGEARVGVPDVRPRRHKAAPGDQRVALVIGGSRGIGAAIARRLANDGLHVGVISRGGKADAAMEGVRCFSADVSDHDQSEAVLRNVVAALQRVDVVVHCATPATPVVDAANLSYSDFESYLRTYLVITAAAVTQLVPAMKERRFGRFIFLGTSYLFGTPPAGLGAYVAAKSALWGLTRSLATELGPFGITANMVSPSMTVTDLTSHISARMKEVEARRTPVRRLAEIEDSAATVGFLARDEASYINGVNLPVAGGPV